MHLHKTINAITLSLLSIQQAASFAVVGQTGVNIRESTLLSSTSTEEQVAEATNPRLEGLALMLDDGTRKSHSIAENTSFVSGFFKGLSTKESYGALMTSLYFVYEAMEESFDKTSDPCVQALDYSELRRLDSLTTDMTFFYGGSWKSTIRPSNAAKAYVARIQHVAQTKPYLLVAHQYTRYLGDLFGGQMMGGMATRSLNLQNGEGVAFYEFKEIPSATDFITEWYTQMNSLDLTESQKQEMVDEANLAFALNIGILEELEGSPIKAMMSMAINSLRAKFGFS